MESTPIWIGPSLNSYPKTSRWALLDMFTINSLRTLVAEIGWGPSNPKLQRLVHKLDIYLTSVKKQAYINLRAYKEFWAQNRVEGYVMISTISIPLGK